MTKRIFFTVLFFIVLYSVRAQVQTQVIGDSVHVRSNTSTSELILENSSKDVQGFLYNKWNGRTEFRRAMIKVSDSVYVFGEDTLKLKSAPGLLFRNGLKKVDSLIEWGADTLNIFDAGAVLSRPTVLNQNSRIFQWRTGSNQFHVTNSPYIPYNSSLVLNYYTPFRVSHDLQGFMYLENNYSQTTGWGGPSFGILFGNRHPAARRFSFYNQMITANIVVESQGTWSNDIDVPVITFGVAGDTLAGTAVSIMGTGQAKYGTIKLPTLVAHQRFCIGAGQLYSGSTDNFLYTRFYADAKNWPFVWKNLPWDVTSTADTVLSIDYDGNVRRKVLSGGGSVTPLIGSATLDFPSTNAGSSSDLAIAVSGVADGDVVSLGVPNGSTAPNSSYTAWVSATDIVTVRFNNYSNAAIDPAAGVFKVKVLK